MRRFAVPVLLAITLLGPADAAPENSPPRSRPAPEFPHRDPDAWLNSAPLSMAGLRGRVVVLDVWTFG